jgi:hemerythrin
MVGLSRAIIQWNGNLYIDNDELNNQHFKFVSILNEMYEAMLWSEGSEVIEKVLRELDEYAITHFSYEEDLMRSIQSPYLKQHTQEHDHFKAKLKEMKERLKKGISTLDLELSAYLNGWMVDHILTMDKNTFTSVKDNLEFRK